MARHADGTIVINTAIETDGFKKGSKDMEAAFRKAAHNLEGVSEKIQISIEKSVQAFEKQNAAYREQEARVESLKAKIEEAQNQKVESEAFTEANKQIDDYQKKLDAAIEKEIRFMETGGSTRSTAYERMEYDIEMLREKIAEAKAEKDRLLQSGEAYTGADISGLTSQLADAQDKLGQMGGKLEVAYASLREKLGEYTSTEQEAAIATAETADNTAQAATTTSEMSSEVEQAAAKGNIFAQAFERIKAVFATIGAIPQSVRESTAALEESLGIVSQVSGESEQAAESIGEMADETERAAGSGVGFSGVYERVKNTMNNAAGAVKKFFAGIKGSGNPLKKFIKYGLGIATVYSLFNKLRSAIKYGIKNIVQFDKKTNTSISGIQSAFAKLKNNLTAAIAPLINALAPYIIKVVDWLNQAITQLAIFFAQLTGQKTYIQAKDVWKDYAQGLKDTSAAAKEAKKNLSGLDEIKTWDSGSFGGSGGSGSGTKAEDMFVTKKLDSSLGDIDWKSFGAKISDGFINVMSKTATWLDNIPWDDIGTKIGDTIKGIDWGGVLVGLSGVVYNLINGISEAISGAGRSLSGGELDLPSMDDTIQGKLSDWERFQYIMKKITSDISLKEFKDYWGYVPSFADYTDAFLTSGGLETLYDRFKEAEEAARSKKITKTLKVNEKALEKIRSLLLLTDRDIAMINAEIIDSGEVWSIYAVIEKAYSRGLITYDMYHKALIRATNDFENFNQGQEEVNKRAAENAIGTSTAIQDIVKRTVENAKAGGQEAGRSYAEGFELELRNGKLSIIKAGETIIDDIRKNSKNLISQLVATFGKQALERANQKAAKAAGEAIGDALGNGIISSVNQTNTHVADYTEFLIGQLEDSMKPGEDYYKKKAAIRKLKSFTVPYLASGAVIPPNAPFTAVLGDQKHGTNVEAPLETIKQALREVLGSGTGGGNTYNITATANGKTLFQLLLEEGRNAQMQTGKNPFLLA